MSRIEKSARKTVHTATEAVETAAQAVLTARKAVRTAKQAGKEAKVVAKQVADRVTGRDAQRNRQRMAIAAGAATVAVAGGVVAHRLRRNHGRKH